ncbi:hypothetical protein C8J57DRAFT_369331 [Mycena rebaudengoi]|nr:hypothetical protein C8J57DRAFT_369331 [Mycena rebaudengoi]
MAPTPTFPPTSSSPSSPAKNTPKSTVPIIIAVVAAVVIVICLGMLAFHLRRQKKNKIRDVPARRGKEVQAGEIVSRTHPAALMITPADGKGTPRFIHTPGTNMRIASRRSDGAWEFADPRAPFTPAIIADPSDLARPTSRNSAAVDSSDSMDPPPSRAPNTPYSHASYSYDSPVPGSSNALLPPPTASTVSSYYSAQTARNTDWDPHPRSRSPWEHSRSRSPSPSPAGNTLRYPPSSASFVSSSRRSSVSSEGSFLDLDPPTATSSNPFLTPPATGTPRGARSPMSPLRSPAVSVHAPLDPLATPAARAKEAESRAARDIRLGYERFDHDSEYAPYAGPSELEVRLRSPEPPMTPAALAKETESRAAREIRRGYERIDRSSEYAVPDESPPSY